MKVELTAAFDELSKAARYVNVMITKRRFNRTEAKAAVRNAREAAARLEKILEGN